MNNKYQKRLGGIFCRSVGPGGTTIEFWATPKGIMCVWTNENCPYDFGEGTIDDETFAHSDGHNVSWLSAKDLERMLKAAKKSDEGSKRNEPDPYEGLTKSERKRRMREDNGKH